MEHDLRVGCIDEFKNTFPRPPLVDVCFHNMAVQIALSRIIDVCIYYDDPIPVVMSEAREAKRVLDAATSILHKNFGEE